MKKILSLGVASAVLSLTAVAASAAIAPVFTPEVPVAGETLTVEIVANGMTQEATTFTVKASDNLTETSYQTASIENSMAFYDGTKFTWAGVSVPADGTVLLTITYTVDAASDDEVSVTLIADEGFTDISADAVASVVVDGAEEDQGDVTEEPTVEESSEESSEEVSTEEGLVDEPTVDASEDAGNDADADDTNNGAADNKGNPDTGIALAVVPAVLAGAAIVVAKKRK